jgi:uncharacterized heparinase superfamily protein
MMTMPLIRTTLRYYHTLKYLKPSQLAGQVKFRLHKPALRRVKAPLLRSVESTWIKSIIKPNPLSADDQATFLNHTHNISAPTIWSDVKIDKLWLYNLHYFDVLNSSASIANQKNLIYRWIKENSTANNNGWEPYTLSLRIVNWIKWILAGNIPDQLMLTSLATQIHFLSKRMETHILGNHLFANAKALLFAGCFFQGRLAERWLRRGLKYIRQELKNQILADGGHFELSPMYHAIILEDILDVINIFKSYGRAVPVNWLETSETMLRWLQALTHPDNEIAFFNDAALGVAPTLAELSDYRKLLGYDASITNTACLHLPNSGYARAKKSSGLLIVDIAAVGASYQPGHAHADSLSFEFSLKNQRIIVNSGTSTYSNTEQRRRERGTAAHNTAVVNDENSSDVWKSFRVARRARVYDTQVKNTEDEIVIQGSHDGYARKHDVTHTRRFELTHNKLFIQDDFTGTRIHNIKLFFHIHPAIKIIHPDVYNFILIDADEQPLAALTTNQPGRVLDSTYHPGFNLSQANKMVVIEMNTALPARFKTFITWNT